ncbi:MAG: urea amidolyase, partial [Pseudomonadota bacterium]
LGGQGTHLAAGLGRPVKERDRLSVGKDGASETGLYLCPGDRFGGGVVRIVPSLQTTLFSPDERHRFEATTFERDTRGNRMGVRLQQEGEGFSSEAGLSVLSEVVVPGDIQITGDGSPFVLLSECQTTGGYPRIGSVLPADLPRVVQARPGESLCFRFVSLDEATEIEKRADESRRTLHARLSPLVRDPSTIPDLLTYQLISGVSAGDELEGNVT